MKTDGLWDLDDEEPQDNRALRRWQIVTDKRERVFSILNEGDRNWSLIIADVYRSRSNAEMIAAAPEMLHELKETKRDLLNWDGTDEAMAVILANLNAMIAKAEGRLP